MHPLVTTINIEGGILGLVNVNTFYLRWLMCVWKGSENLKVNVAFVSASVHPKVGASNNLGSAVYRLELRVLLSANLFDHAQKADKHISFILLKFSWL